MVNRKSGLLLATLLTVCVGLFSNTQGRSFSDEPKPIKAAEGIIKAFDRFPLVALGEMHQGRNQHDFILSLVQHPAFARKVNDIVVEFGNALYQPIMDRYIAGETVDHKELRQVWRNTYVTSMAWDLPFFEQFFATVRAVNQRLPKNKQLRVLLGDPPVDWSIVKSWKDLGPFMDRDGTFVEVVEREVLAKKRKALLIAGVFHLYRCCPPSPDRRRLTTTQRLDKSHPGTVFVIITHDGFDGPNSEENDALEKRLVSWPQPSLAFVKNTWLGNLSPNAIFSSKLGFLLKPDGTKVPAPSPYGGLKIQEIMDAYLYLAPKAAMVQDTVLPPEVLQDEEYQRELKRRRSIPR